jgi:hypothetical protein
MKMEDENVIKKLIDGFNISECKIEPHVELDFTYVEKFNFDTWKGTTVQYNKMMAPILLYCAYSQIKSINNSIKLIDKERYDIIIRTRPDVMYLKDIKSIINNLNFSSNTIFIQNSNEGGHLYAGEFSNCPCDWFYMGDSNTMILFTQLLKNSFKDKYKYGVIHGRDFVRSVARDNGINLQLIDFGAVLYKQTPLFDKQFIIPIDFYNNDFNGNVNNSFAKLTLSNVSKCYVPVEKFKRVLPHVVEKIGRLKFRFRYHNGILVDFMHQQFNFSLKFECRFNCSS